ncbi:hypothetical protein ACU4GH_20685 [Bradyrhizobium betae]
MLKLDLVKEEMRNPVAAAEAVGRMPGRADLSPSPTVANELVAHLLRYRAPGCWTVASRSGCRRDKCCRSGAFRSNMRISLNPVPRP